MRKSFLLTVVQAVMGAWIIMAGLLGTAPAQAQSQDDCKVNRTLSVHGQGVVFGSPDVLQARIGVETEAINLNEALAQNNRQMRAVLDQLAALDIEAKDIRTEDLFIREKTDQNGNFVGYLITNAVRVTIRQIDEAGTILDQAVQAGANLVADIQFVINDPTPLLSQARALAVEAAQEKAQELAQAAGVALGKPLTISELRDEFIPHQRVASEVLFGNAIPIAEGQQSVTVSVEITFEINSAT
jgi:uncharacterized protein